MDRQSKTADLHRWYIELLPRADVAESSSIPGCTVLRPYGYRIWEMIRTKLSVALRERSYETASFPLFIPEQSMKSLPEHYVPFAKELLFVQEKGLFLRPTSEMIMYPVLRSWIRERGLPLKISQFGSVVRWEGIKPNFPLIRDNEFLWQESHSLHKTAAEAIAEAEAMISVYQNLVECSLAIPCFSGEKPAHRRFAGAENTLALEAIMPNLKSVQIATSHYLAQRFSAPLDLKDEGSPVFQSCHGITTRLIGALVLLHGDDDGLVLPPKVAPIQVACSLKDAGMLRAAGIRAEPVDDWRVKGVPLHLEDGRITRRDTGESIFAENTVPVIKKLLESIQERLLERALTYKKTTSPKTFDNFCTASTVVKAPWCGSVPCAKETRIATKKSLRVLSPEKGECIRCAQPAGVTAVFAEAY